MRPTIHNDYIDLEEISHDWDDQLNTVETKTKAVKTLFNLFLNEQLPYRLRANACNMILSKINDKSNLLIQFILLYRDPRKMIFAFYESFERSIHLEMLQNEIHLQISKIENQHLFAIIKPLLENLFKSKSNQSLSIIEAFNQNNIHEIYEHFIYFLLREDQLNEVSILSKINDPKINDHGVQLELVKQIKLWVLHICRELSFFTGAPAEYTPVDEIEDDHGYFEDSFFETPKSYAYDDDESLESISDLEVVDLSQKLDGAHEVQKEQLVYPKPRLMTPIQPSAPKPVKPEPVKPEPIKQEKNIEGSKNSQFNMNRPFINEAREISPMLKPQDSSQLNVSRNLPESNIPISKSTLPIKAPPPPPPPPPLKPFPSPKDISSPYPLAPPEMPRSPQVMAPSISQAEAKRSNIESVVHDLSDQFIDEEQTIDEQVKPIVEDVIEKGELPGTADEWVSRKKVFQEPSYFQRFRTWLSTHFVDEDQSKPLDERLASDELGEVGGVEKLLSQLKFLLKIFYHTMGLRSIKIIHFMDLIVTQFTEYFQGIFRGFKNIKSAYRVLKRSQNASLVDEMQKEITSVQQELAYLWRISHRLEKYHIYEKSYIPLQHNPLTQLIQLRDLISQLKNDLDYINVGEFKSTVKGSMLGFFTSFIPNPIDFLTPIKDALIIVFSKPMHRTEISGLYADFVEMSDAFLLALERVHSPKIDEQAHYASQVEYHQTEILNDLRHQLKRVLYHSLNSYFYAQPKYWRKKELISELYHYLIGEYHDLDMIAALEIEKYIKPLLINTLIKLQKDQEEILKELYPMLDQKSFLLVHGKEREHILMPYQEELKLKNKLYQRLFDHGLLY